MNQFNQFGFGGLNQMMGPNGFSNLSDEDLLKELRNFAVYGLSSQNLAALQLLHTLGDRFQASTRKTNTPTRDIQGGGHLFTSVYKDGVMTHYFVDHQETKEKIDKIFELTKTNRSMTDEFAQELNAKRVADLMALGTCFRGETVDEYGNRLTRPVHCPYITVIGKEGFGEDSLHQSKNLPVLAFDAAFPLINGFDRDKFHDFIHSLANFKLRERPLLIDLEELDRYFAEVDVLDQYKRDVRKALEVAGISSDANLYNQPVQVQIFGKGSPIQIKLLGGLRGYSQWTKGFLNRAEYPEIVVVPANNAHYNSGGPNGPGFAW